MTDTEFRERVEAALALGGDPGSIVNAINAISKERKGLTSAPPPAPPAAPEGTDAGSGPPSGLFTTGGSV